MRTLLLILFFVSGPVLFSQEPLKIKVVKPAGKCSATLLGKPGGNISKEELKFCNDISVKGPCDYKVVSFLFSCNFKGRLFDVSANDGYFPSGVKAFLVSLSPGEKFFIEKIKAKSNVTGQVFDLPALTFKVVP